MAAGAPPARKPRTSAAQRRAVLLFVAPFGLLFLAFYAVPIVFAVVQSLLTVERKCTFGPHQQVLVGLVK
jgi:multiple sugar transport system permease protein